MSNKVFLPGVALKPFLAALISGKVVRDSNTSSDAPNPTELHHIFALDFCLPPSVSLSFARLMYWSPKAPSPIAACPPGIASAANIGIWLETSCIAKEAKLPNELNASSNSTSLL